MLINYKIQVIIFIVFCIVLCNTLYVSSMVEGEKALSSEDLSLVKLYDGMIENAKQLNKDNQFAESEAVFKQAVDGLEAILGSNHPKTLSTVQLFALSFTDRNRQLSPMKSDYEKAIHLLDSSLSGFEQSFGKDSANLMTSVSLLSLLYRALQRNEESRPHFERILEHRRNTLGESHSDTLKAASDLASVYGALGLWLESKDLYEHTYELLDATVGAHHKDTLTAQFYYAAICVRLGKSMEARVFIDRVVEFGPSVLGPDSPITKKAIKFKELLSSKDLSDKTSTNSRDNAKESMIEIM